MEEMVLISKKNYDELVLIKKSVLDQTPIKCYVEWGYHYNIFTHSESANEELIRANEMLNSSFNNLKSKIRTLENRNWFERLIKRHE